MQLLSLRPEVTPWFFKLEHQTIPWHNKQLIFVWFYELIDKNFKNSLWNWNQREKLVRGKGAFLCYHPVKFKHVPWKCTDFNVDSVCHSLIFCNMNHRRKSEQLKSFLEFWPNNLLCNALKKRGILSNTHFQFFNCVSMREK